MRKILYRMRDMRDVGTTNRIDRNSCGSIAEYIRKSYDSLLKAATLQAEDFVALTGLQDGNACGDDFEEAREAPAESGHEHIIYNIQIYILIKDEDE